MLASVLIAVTSCKDPDGSGKDILPPDDYIEGVFIDTFNVVLRPIWLDSAYTQNRSQALLGQILDPEFGTITATSYSQWRMQGADLLFGSDPSKLVLDSIVLSLDLNEFYGRYDDPLNLEVYEITENLAYRDSLWSNSHVSFDSTYNFAAGKQINFQGRSGFFDWIDIRLDDSLGRKLLYAPVDSLKTNASLMNYFSGLAVRATVDGFPSREPGGIFYMDLRSAKSGLMLYYHDSTAAKQYEFIVSDESQRFHSVRRSNFTDKLFWQNYIDSTNPYPAYAFLQSAAMIKMKVDIPGLTNLGPILVNRAELLLNEDPQYRGSENRFIPVEQIFIFIADSTGKKELDETTSITNSTYSNSLQRYTIPMTNTVMQVANGTIDNHGFIIVPNLNGITVNRSVVAGSGHPNPELRPKLKVIYTTLPGN